MTNPVDYFDSLRFWGKKRNRILQKLKVYGLANKAIDTFANLYLPLYFKATANNPKYKLESSRTAGNRIIVSLTSFPKRLPTLHLVIETLLRQTVKPDMIILHLTKSQIKDINLLPDKLKSLTKRGLHIKLCPDEIRSHTKYYYAFRNFPEETVITVDDDLFYRSDLIEHLLRNANMHKRAVIANWTKEIIAGKQKYTEWPDSHTVTSPKRNRLILGVGGVLYPPNSVHEDIFNIQNITSLSLTADDVWITSMLLKKGTSIYYSGYDYHYLPVNIKNNETLISGNYVRNQQCIDAINKYYAESGNEMPFYDIPIQNERSLSR